MLVKVPVSETNIKQWMCDNGKGRCYSGSIKLKESIQYHRYECVFNSPPCTFRLCESCGIIYAKGKKVVDILHVKRPPNKKLWSAFFDSDIKTQKAIPIEKIKQDYIWGLVNGFSTKDIKASNFAKLIPLDSKFMVIIDGNSSNIFPDQAAKTAKLNLFLVDLLTDKIHMKRTVNHLRPYAACARGGREELSRIYMIGGQDHKTGKWTNLASYLNIVDIMNAENQKKPVELEFHSEMPYILIGPSMYLAKTNAGKERIYVTGVDNE